MSAPWESHHDLADIAARLGRSPQTVRRLVEADPGLRAAARCWAGTVWLPASALAAWWARLPGLDAAPLRVVRRRAVAGRFFGSGHVVAGRTEGEARRAASE
jgi:predicted transcriptional regulator